MSPDTYLVSIFYAVLIFLGLLGLAIAIQVFRKRLSWGCSPAYGCPDDHLHLDECNLRSCTI